MKVKKAVLLLFSVISVNCILSDVLNAGLAPAVWDVLRNEFTMDHEAARPEVQAQIQWLVSHPGYLQQLIRSKPYIYHIVMEVKKRHLPGELALLPMIESAFNPFACSRAGAVGLWQFMPDTGNTWGLKQDWWFDGRRSVRASTDAALNYLTWLEKYFDGNWQLAIAAYDAGEGGVSRAIKNSGQSSDRVDFWSLPVPAETRAYVPRLLALAEIIRDPAQYHVSLPDILHTPYFEEVNIGSQIDLNRAARLAGIPYKELIKLNPGFNRWVTAPYKPFKLLIPAEKVAEFIRRLSQIPKEKRASLLTHQVQPGESLISIAERYFTSTKLIIELNQLSSSKLKDGQSILIPASRNTLPLINKPPASQMADEPPSPRIYKVLHIVQAGDTFQSLEKNYNVTENKIRIWNKFDPSVTLYKGQQLIIWRNKMTPSFYTVVMGDSLGTISKRYNTTISSLTKLNPTLNNTVLKPGQRLIVG